MSRFIWVILAACSLHALEVPALKSRVMDQAGMLDEVTKQNIEASLANLEAQTTAQVAVLTVPSLSGDVLEDYSMKVVEAWKLGTEKGDNGILFLIAKQDRKMRIEVGQGLEGAIPDVYAKRILDDQVSPLFRQGEFARGIEVGVEWISKLIRKEVNLEELAPQTQAATSTSSPNPFFSLWFTATVFTLMAASYMSRKVASILGLGWYGLGFFLATPLEYPSVGFLLIFFILSIVLKNMKLPSGRSGSGSYGGSSYRSSSSSSGSFSGGGGSFSGGGSSSSW